MTGRELKNKISIFQMKHEMGARDTLMLVLDFVADDFDAANELVEYLDKVMGEIKAQP